MARLKLSEIEDYYSDDSGYDRDFNEHKKKKLTTIYKRQSRKKDSDGLAD